MTLRFQDALKVTKQFIETNYSGLGEDPIVIRNIYGRISIIVQCEKNKESEKLSAELAEKLGNFAYLNNATFIYAEDVFAFDAVVKSPDKLTIPDTNPPIYLLDKQITGQDWLRQPVKENPHPPRVTLFGIKGGVGRSTALAVWAWYLAEKLGKKVLIIDLDLESPGIGSILLPMERMPDYGVVDWLVEDAVEQADDELLCEMVARSPLSDRGEGEIRVVCAAGSKEQDYIAKLSRVYMDINHNGEQLDFAHRIAKMLQQLEAQEKPDIVLLDSRAGIHDIAAIAITRLTDLALLFAVNTPQTWQAYHYLFSHWQKWNKNLTEFRSNLKIVAAMIPETNREEYISSLTESACDLFSETLYDMEEDNIESFNFDVNAIDAPHYPLKVFWYRAFQDFNPLKQFNSQDVQLCYGDFLQQATQLALGGSIE